MNTKSIIDERKGKIGSKESGIGLRFHDACLEKWKIEEITKHIVMNWVNKNSGFLIFLGDTGVGKTYMCSALVNYYYSIGLDVCYIPRRLSSKKLEDVVAEYYEPNNSQFDVMIFDDIDLSLNDPCNKTILRSVIENRFNSGKTTVITASLTKETLELELNLMPTDLMIKSGANICIEKKGQSLRSILG